MLTTASESPAKIINPDLIRLAPRGAETSGEYGVIVKLAQPEKLPNYMRDPRPHSPGHIKARISFDQIDRMIGDHNVVSVEFCEHVMQ